MGHMPIIPANQGRLFGSLLISTKKADTDPIETTSKPKKGKLTVERKMMLRGKDNVAIRLDQTANAVDLNVFRSKTMPTSLENKFDQP